MRLRGAAAVAAMCALATIWVVGASAAPPTFAPAEHACEIQGGVFFDFDPSYGCAGISESDEIAFMTGQEICEHAYGGVFLLRPSGYICQV